MKNDTPIIQMYYGNRGRSANIKGSQEYFRLLKLVAEGEEELMNKLTEFPELLAFYQKANEQTVEMHSELAAERYAEGFRFGFLLALDVMGKYNA